MDRATLDNESNREVIVRGKPLTIIDLFDQLEERSLAIGHVVVAYNKSYVTYSTKRRSFMTVQLLKDKIKVDFSTPWVDAPKAQPSVMADITESHRMGNTQFVLTEAGQLEHVLLLASLSYNYSS